MKYFSLNELISSNIANKEGIDNQPNSEQKLKLIKLIETVLDPLREEFGKPIYVSSGFRCPELNSLVGGVPNSQHLKAESADLICSDNKALYETAIRLIKQSKITVGQLINEKNYSWIHISLPYSKINQIL